MRHHTRRQYILITVLVLSVGYIFLHVQNQQEFVQKFFPVMQQKEAKVQTESVAIELVSGRSDVSQWAEQIEEKGGEVGFNVIERKDVFDVQVFEASEERNITFAWFVVDMWTADTERIGPVLYDGEWELD